MGISQKIICTNCYQVEDISTAPMNDDGDIYCSDCDKTDFERVDHLVSTLNLQTQPAS